MIIHKILPRNKNCLFEKKKKIHSKSKKETRKQLILRIK